MEDTEQGGQVAQVGLLPTPWEWSFIAVLALALVPGVLGMSRVWSTVDFASHGYIVPFVALWAASSKRALLPQLPRTRDPRGSLALVVGFVVYVFGFAASIVALQGLAVVLCVSAAVLYLRGPAWLRALAFPLAYLLFMVPLPEALVTPLIVELQLLVSSVAVDLLQRLGMVVLRVGNVIELPGGGTLFVAEACSGITSVVTLIPIGVFLAYFTQRTLPRRVVLVAAVVPLALLGNLIRVAGTVTAAARWGAEAATAGDLHDLAGILAYILGCLALLAVGALMNRFVPPKAPAASRAPASGAAAVSGDPRAQRSSP